MQIKFQKEATTDNLRSALEACSFENSTIQEFGATENREFLIRTPETAADPKRLTDRIDSALATAFGTGGLRDPADRGGGPQGRQGPDSEGHPRPHPVLDRPS